MIVLTSTGIPAARSTSVPGFCRGRTRAHRSINASRSAKRNSPYLRAADNALSSASLAQKGLSGVRLPQVRASGTASAAPHSIDSATIRR